MNYTLNYSCIIKELVEQSESMADSTSTFLPKGFLNVTKYKLGKLQNELPCITYPIPYRQRLQRVNGFSLHDFVQGLRRFFAFRFVVKPGKLSSQRNNAMSKDYKAKIANGKRCHKVFGSLMLNKWRPIKYKRLSKTINKNNCSHQQKEFKCLKKRLHAYINRGFISMV